MESLGRGKVFFVYRGLEESLANVTLSLSTPRAVAKGAASWWVREMMALADCDLALFPPTNVWWDEELEVLIWLKPWLPQSVGLFSEWPESLRIEGAELESELQKRGLEQRDFWDVRRKDQASSCYVVDWSDLAKLGQRPPLVQSR